MSDLLQTLSAFIDRKIKNASVALPAIVTKTTPSSQKVDVQIMVYENDGESITIPDVEVLQMQMSANTFIYQPVAVGTQGIIIALDRQSSVFYEAATATAQKTNSDRAHDLSDCVFIPGFWQTSKACQPSADDTTEIKYNSMRISLYPNGKIEIAGASYELLAVLAAGLGYIKDGLVAAATSNCVNGAPLSLAAQITTAANNLNAEIVKLNTLKV